MPQSKNQKRQKVLAQREAEFKQMYDELIDLLSKNPEVRWNPEFDGEVPPLQVIEALAREDGPWGLCLPSGSTPQRFYTRMLTKAQEIENLYAKQPWR